VISAASSRDTELFIEKALHRKKSANDFLQNEAKIAALKEMHDKASYQLSHFGLASSPQKKEPCGKRQG